MLNLDFLRRSKKETPSPAPRKTHTSTFRRAIFKGGDLPDEHSRTPTPHRADVWRPDSWVSDGTDRSSSAMGPSSYGSQASSSGHYDSGYSSDMSNTRSRTKSRRQVPLPPSAEANASYESVAPFGFMHHPQPKSAVPSRGWGRSPIPGAVAAAFIRSPSMIADDHTPTMPTPKVERTRSRTTSHSSSHNVPAAPSHRHRESRRDSHSSSISPTNSSRSRATSHSTGSVGSIPTQSSGRSSIESAAYPSGAVYSRSRHDSEVHSTAVPPRPLLATYQTVPHMQSVIPNPPMPRRHSESAPKAPPPDLPKRGSSHPVPTVRSSHHREAGYSTDEESRKKGILKAPREVFPVPKTPEDVKRMLSPVPLELPPEKTKSRSKQTKYTVLVQEEQPIVEQLRPYSFPILTCDLREDVIPAKNIRRLIAPIRLGYPPTLKALTMDQLGAHISETSTPSVPFQEMLLSFSIRNVDGTPCAPLRWMVTIYVKRGITYRDLFEKAYDCLHECLDRNKKEDAKHIDDPQTLKAHRARAREGPQLEQVELKKGPRRVDALRGAHYFDGLFFDKKEKRWIMLLSPKEKFLSFGLNIPPCFSS